MRDAEHYRQSYEAGEPPWDIGKPDFNLIEIVTTRPISPCKALEIGCGTGDNAVWLAQQGFEVLAVDFSPIAIEKARHKAAQAGVSCTFLVHDVLEREVEGGPFHFAFDRGFLHLIDSEEERRSVAAMMSRCLDENGLWLSLLGNADEARDGPGPPRRSAREIVTAVEPCFEILSLTSSHFELSILQPHRAWVSLMKQRVRTA
ncbi:MAG TPA: class I SAM-dependent methyltransferase [Bryobacteraceae bacterium]|nr:class I SAM-dependent methyltransferase [Bryobacteraceae bacterium]